MIATKGGLGHGLQERLRKACGESLGPPADELRLLRDRSPVMLPIPGTSPVDHLEANMQAAA